MLEKEYKYYLDNKDELNRKYNNKYIVIVGENIVGVYDSENDAYIESENKFSSGTFYIQYCNVKGGSVTQTFHSRVSFV